MKAFTMGLMLLWGLVFFLTLGWKPDFAYNAQRYFEILLLGGLACAGLALPWRLKMGRWPGVLLGMLWLAAISVVLVNGRDADSTWLAWREFLQWTGLLALVLVVAKARAQAGAAVFDRAAFMGVVLFVLGACLIVLEGLTISLMSGLVDWHIIYGAFVNVRVFALIMLWLLLLLPAANRYLQGGWQLCIWLAAIAGWGLLLFTGTRALLLVLPFALLGLALVTGKQALPWWRRFLLQFGGGFCVFLLLRWGTHWLLGTVKASDDAMLFVRAGTSGRWEHWLTAWQHFLLHPWFGNGPGSFACFTRTLEASPHNLVMQLLAEWGLMVTLLVAVWVLYLLGHMIRTLRQPQAEQSELHLSLFVALLAVAANSMLDGTLLGPLQQMVILLLAGWGLHAYAGANFEVRQGRTLRLAQGCYVLILVPFLATVLLMMKVDIPLQKQLLTLPDGSINLNYGPRYWADGHDHCPIWQQRTREHYQHAP